MSIKQYPLKIDAVLLHKLKIIASYNSRSINKEIEHLIKKNIEDFEKNNHKIELTNLED
nr:hypothetical protein [Fusobacterium gastrosuis]